MDGSKTNDIPIKWLKFLINWRVPIGLILNALSLNTLINNLPQDDLFSILFEIFYGLIAIILPILTLAYCIKFKLTGYYLLKSLLIIEVFSNSTFSALNTISLHEENPLSDFFVTFLPLIILSLFLWIYPNFKYLKKRKHLFITNKKVSCSNNTPQKKQDLQKPIKKQTQKKEEITFSINKRKLVVVISSLLVFILIFLAIFFLFDYINSLKDDLSSFKRKYNTVNSKYASLQLDYNEMESKLNFYDENIVFVLEGYGNYYYTYDQVKQVTQGNHYSYWAYNKSAAIGKGYQAFQSESSWEKYKSERQQKSE